MIDEKLTLLRANQITGITSDFKMNVIKGVKPFFPPSTSDDMSDEPVTWKDSLKL